jgi:hypothetical protein
MSQATSATTPTGAPVKAGRSFCPLTCARDRLVAELMMLAPPRIPITPDGEDIRALGDHLTNVARAVDTYIEMIGRELASNSPSAVDRSQFHQVVLKGIEGFALFEIEQTAREWDEYNEANSQFGVGA